MNGELVRALDLLEEERGVSKRVLIEAVESALVSAYKKNFGGSGQNVRVEVDSKTGEIRVFSMKTIVEEVHEPGAEMALEEMRKEDPSAELGDVVEEEITPRDFGRIAAQAAKQVVVQRIREAEREMIKKEFEEREKQVVTGVVQRIEKRNVFIDLGRIEGVLSPTEQIPRESYRQGERLRVYVTEVRDTVRGPQIHVSRAHPGLVRALFEQEVPEIREGIVIVQNIAREPGARTKIAVYSRDRNVDPVGACVGPKGSRVQAVVDELRGEKIDIVPWAGDPAQFVASALQPAKVVRVENDEETKTANVVVPDNQLSLAIGREGQNARLAAKLTGWRIDIKSEKQMREEQARKLFVDLTPEELAAYGAGTGSAGQAQDGDGESAAGAKANGEGDGAGLGEAPAADVETVPVTGEKAVEAHEEGSGSSG